MRRQRMIRLGWMLMGGLALATSRPALAQRPQTASTPQAASTPKPAVGLEASLLRSLLANPDTAGYSFSTERRGSKVALKGRVGSRYTHDVAIQTAIALGVPVIDDLVIDTFEGRRVAANQVLAYPASGPGAPGPRVIPTPPSLYPLSLFGGLGDPFLGIDPPLVVYPPDWAALSARRLGPPQAANGTPTVVAPNGSLANPPADPSDPQAAGIPSGTIDMAIDPRGIATLRGTVPSLADKIAIGQRAAQVPGVWQIINLLTVRTVAPALSDKPPPPPVPADLPAQAKAQAPAPARPLAPAMPNEGPAIVADSDPIGQRAARAISNRATLAGGGVKVKVRDGVATLSGKVATVYEAMVAFRAVQRTPGVREIEDRLEFVVPDGNGPNPLADKGRPEDVEPYLEAQIRRQVGDLAHVDRVRVQGTSLELRGTLEREEDRTRFDAIINSMAILRGFRITAEMPAEPR